MKLLALWGFNNASLFIRGSPRSLDSECCRVHGLEPKVELPGEDGRQGDVPTPVVFHVRIPLSYVACVTILRGQGGGKGGIPLG